MGTRTGGEAGHFLYGVGSGSNSTAMMRVAAGKPGMEWDSSDWKWDGDLFLGTRLNSMSSPNYQSRQLFPLQSGIPMPRFSSNSSSSCSDEANLGIERSKVELEKRRRVNLIVEEEDDDVEEERGRLSLRPGGGGNGGYVRRRAAEVSEVVNWEGGASGKRPKLMGGGGGGSGANSNRVVCRVEDCGADLTQAKTYHRRHKVCEMHSKASKALVGNVLQRFCQQCSRFHVLQEFDEGKRSCRRRLAGHNRRRRKAEPETVVNSSSLNDNQSTGYLLISLLKILSDIHSNRTNNAEDQDLLSHLLRNLASNGNLHEDTNIFGLLQESRHLLNNHLPLGNSDIVSALLSNNNPQGFEGLKQQHESGMPHKGLHIDHARVEEVQAPACTEARDSSPRRTKMNNFDLNDVYIDSDDSTEDVVISPVPASDSLQSSPPQTSGNSDSASSQSPSSSSVDTQTRTGHIIFKIFGKEPSDFPFVLRAQILDWLSHSPSEIESYIRPGCIILTIHLRLSESLWEELCSDLSSSLERLVDIADDVTFWGTGWIYVRVQNQVAFMYNGQVVADAYLPMKGNCSTIQSIKPIAVSESEQAQFLVKGYNLLRPSTSLLCGVEGNYLVQDANNELVESVDSLKEHDGIQCLSLSVSIPAKTGRGFIEVESYAANSSFFPFIVAEKDVCTEIRMLERDIDLTETEDAQDGNGTMKQRSGAMDFLHEMGWLLHRSNLKSRLGQLDLDLEHFSFKRFKWLMEFSMDHDWCAVVKKLLDILLDGTVGAGESSFLKVSLFEMGLLHRAVRRNSRTMVELLLGYVPQKVADELKLEYNTLVGGAEGSFLFRPDAVGPAGLTPLHVAAGRDDSENLLDAFTDDPGKVGIEAWKNARDSTGSTPEDYARLRGYYSYIHLVQRKMNRKLVTGDVVLEIPSTVLECNDEEKKNEERLSSLHIDMTEIRRSSKRACKRCEQSLVYGNARRSLLYRPAMLSMVAVAAVCVCVALLLKSSPEVLFVLHPFRWEKLESGCS